MSFRLRLFLSLILVALFGTLFASNFLLRQRLRAQETRLLVLDQETRSLKQQLEAERILSAAQSRLLQRLSSTASTPPPTDLTPNDPGLEAQP